MTLVEELKAAAQYTALDGVKELLERAAAAVPCWQPIETAPRDGTSVLGFGRMDGEISGDMGPPSATVMQCRYGEWTVTHTDAYSVQVFPTHWMPLPPPPLASQGEQA